jgi:hypothetical protein
MRRSDTFHRPVQTHDTDAVSALKLGVVRELGAVTVTLLLFACGQVKDHEPAQAPLAIDAELCHFLDRCHPELLPLFAGGSLDACLAWASCSDVVTDWTKKLSDAAGCAAFVQAATCEEIAVKWYGSFGAPLAVNALWFDAGSACTWPARTFPAPPAPDGGTCLTSEGGGCESGAYCAIGSAEQLVGFGYCGSCTPDVADGAACADTSVCVDGDHCVDGRCRAVLSAGRACSENVECDSWNCTGGYCVARPGQRDGSILPADDFGQPCDDSNDRCLETPFSACVGGVCVPRPDLGEACDFGDDCRFGAVCASGICVAEECVARAGEPCGQTCEAGTTCDSDTFLCTSLPGAGEPCVSAQCAPPYVCGRSDTPDGVCVRLRENGEPCQAGTDCASSFCARDYSPYCAPTGCDVPACDSECGVCADVPTRSACE